MKKRGILVGVAIMVTAIGFGVWWKISRPPVYQGKSIHHWMGQYGNPYQGYHPSAGMETYLALYSMGPKAAPFLIEIAKNPESTIATWYRRLWLKLPSKVRAGVPIPSPEPDSNIPLLALRVLQELIRSYDAELFERLVPDLEHLACGAHEDTVQMLAGDTLGILAAKHPVPSVITAAKAVLGTTNPAVCYSLLHGYMDVWDTHGKFAFEPHLLLQNPDHGVRLYAAFLLYKHTTFTNEAMMTLLEGVKSPDDPTRVRAASMLAQLGESARSAVPLLISALEVVEPESHSLILESLAQLDPDRSWKPEPTIKELVLQVGDPNDDANNRYIAGKKLRALGPKAIEAAPSLLARMAHDKNYACPYAEVLWVVDPSKAPEIIDAMTTVLKDDAGPYQYSRFSAALMLAKMGPAAGPAAPLLESLLGDRDALVSQSAAYAILKIGASGASENARALKVLTASLRRDTQITHHRRSSALRLGDIGAAAEPALPMLCEVVRTDGDFNVRRLAAEAIEKIESALNNQETLRE